MPFWNFYTFSTYITLPIFFSRFTTYLQFTINPNIVSLFWYQSIIYRLLLLLLSYNHIMIAYCVLKKKTMQWNLFHESYVCIFLIFFFKKGASILISLHYARLWCHFQMQWRDLFLLVIFHFCKSSSNFFQHEITLELP